MVEGRVFGSVIDLTAIPCFGLRMYRRSVLRSDHLVPHVFYVLENNVLLCVRWCDCAGSVTASIAMLTKWFSSTRLETRTKESNIYASIWVENPDA